MDDFFCHGCAKYRSVAVLAPERRNAGGVPARGMNRKQCTACRDRIAARQTPDDVIGHFPHGGLMRRRHQTTADHNKARRHYRNGTAFKGWT